jgi:stage II sporulation protein D
VNRLIVLGVPAVAAIIATAAIISMRSTGTVQQSAPPEPVSINPIADRIEHQSVLPLRDSVSLLLFAGFKVERLVIRSTDSWSMNGQTRQAGDSIVIERSADGLLIDGKSVKEAEFRSRSDGTFELSARERSRKLRGRITVQSAGNLLRITAIVSRDEYLAGVLASEASANDPIDYLVALSVLQRNYLQSHGGRHEPESAMCDNTHCQVAFLNPIPARMRSVVELASGMTLQSGTALPCYYSGSCGGQTITPGQIWERREPGYLPVQCRYCSGSRWYRWQRSIVATPEVDRLMGTAPAPPFLDDDFKIRVGRVIGFNIVLSNTVRSIQRRGDRYFIEGSGFGHRVGLCQEGARRLARDGMSAEGILRYYFPGVQQQQITGSQAVE